MSETPRPVLRVVRGEPAPEELAALVAVVTARAGTAGGSGPAGVSAWRDPARLVREPIFAGRGAWRASAWPR
jgi:hypothetical protein